MKRQRIRDFIIEFIIIALSFGISEYFAVQVFQSEKWYVELIVYVVVFMLLQGIVSYAKRWIEREDIEKVKNSKKAIVMSAFDNSEFEKYKVEAQEKWGQTDAYRQHAEKTKHYSKQKWNDLAEGMDHIMSEFAFCMKKGERPDSIEAQNLVKMLQNHITENYYLCTNEILMGLGQMYVADERFKNNIDKHASGTAAFICEAIEVYCRK